jgi:hypothetical protein
MNSPARWWVWLTWTVAVWTPPCCIMAIWSVCYARYFGEPGPFSPWSGLAIDALLAITGLFIVLYLVRFSRHPGWLGLVFLAATTEVLVTVVIYSLASASVAGFYF